MYFDLCSGTIAFHVTGDIMSQNMRTGEVDESFIWARTLITADHRGLTSPIMWARKLLFPPPSAHPPMHILWPSPRPPLEPADIVELNFVDTSALGVVNAFERRRLNGRNRAKHSKRDSAMERDEI